MEPNDFFNPNFLKELALSVLNSINDGILIADKVGIIQYVNPEYTRIVGMKPKDLLGKILADVRPGAILPAVIETGKTVSGVYREVKETKYVVDIAPIVHDGNIVGGVSIVKDITEVKKLSKALESAQSSLQKLQSTMESYFCPKYTLSQLKGDSEKLNRTIKLAEKAALADANILLLGESGTGKELIAQGIHNASPRQHGPFVPVNCAAIPSVLLESELFGYADGAFTGARKGGKLGLFQLAHRGTLFLDEIGDMHVDMQAKLLRIIQEQKVRRVGELNEQKIDVRIIAATNQDIEAMVKRGRFRQDLYYRLNAFQLSVPPLRERKEDIINLSYSIANDYDETITFTLSEEVKKLFYLFDWPGNIRELKNVIEYACNMTSQDGEIKIEHLPERMQNSKYHPYLSSEYLQPLKDSVKQFEKKLLQNLLIKFGETLEGKKKIAKILKISVSSLYRKLED
ncbi:sigma 54-interacting transcriptional regulator [bacterium]|nr:sigma 54-interacting transcriptional regulator [bacterium]